jgi:hypothetical protein
MAAAMTTPPSWSAILLAAAIAGCATAGARARAEAPSAAQPAPNPFRAQLRAAERAMARGAFADAEAALARAEALVAGDLDKRVSVAYDRATLAVYRGDLTAAAAALAADLPELATHPEQALEFWAHNELTWVRWAAGDAAGALVECEEQRRSAAAAQLPAADKAALMRHALWDRAYLLRELAAAQPASSRAPMLVYARAARAEYDAAAQAIGGEDGQAVLAAFFAASDGDGAAALQAARRVDAARDDDVQDLYILARALELGGDGAGAASIRARMRASQNVYLGLALYLRQLELDGKRK